MQSAGADGGNYARITLNNEIIELEGTAGNSALQIVIVSSSTGKVILKKVFDTENWQNFDFFIQHFNMPDGSIVVAACKGDCVTNGISEYAKNWFLGLGSKEVVNLRHRKAFAFIGKVGMSYVNEKRGETNE